MARTATARKTKIAAPAFITLQLPPLGAVWPGEGGRFAGIVFDDAGKPAYALILFDGDVKSDITWKDAIAWAKGLKAHGHSDYSLPDRRDGAVLFANNHVLKIEQRAHWLSEQYASESSYAWIKGFSHGNQIITPKVNSLRARAVRRLPL